MEGQRPFNHNIIRSSFVKKHYKETSLQDPILHKRHQTIFNRTLIKGQVILTSHYMEHHMEPYMEGQSPFNQNITRSSLIKKHYKETSLQGPILHKGSSNIDLTLHGTLYGTLHGRTKPIQSKHYKVILGEETLQGNKSSGFNTSQRVK